GLLIDVAHDDAQAGNRAYLRNAAPHQPRADDTYRLDFHVFLPMDPCVPDRPSRLSPDTHKLLCSPETHPDTGRALDCVRRRSRTRHEEPAEWHPATTRQAACDPHAPQAGPHSAGMGS